LGYLSAYGKAQLAPQ
jgi:ABC-type multidrug transport system fused ATPase/permease subunit